VQDGRAERITVVIAVRNGMPFVVEAVCSALMQGPQVEQIIVVDDGSVDGTRAAIDALDNSRVLVIANSGSGVSAARNAGAAVATSRWILFLDADDRLIDGACVKLLTAASRVPKALAVYGDYERVTAEGIRAGRRFVIRARAKPSGQILRPLIRGNFIINGGIMIVDLAAFNRVGGFDPSLSLCEDWHLWCRLAATGEILYIPELVMEYRVHKSSAMMVRRRLYSDFAPALDAIYGDALIRSMFDAQELTESRREAEVSLMTYCATQAYRDGDKSNSISLAFEAARHFPAKAHRVMLRVAGAIAGF
jgi:glycosyltransferase involved in cell wall biosynthesis